MKIPIFTTYQNIQADEDLYNKYFSISNMDNNNVFKAAYDFINNEFYISWKSDEI